ncbi:MAG: zinc metallopeptidase [Verrucomicrobiales bacterium]|nr:zinc metallopeptidase [Verrucomicrobiales bacterium]
MQIFLILFAVTLGFTMWGRKKFRRVYDEELQNTIGSKITGAELARKILESKGITNIEIVKGKGILPDFYDPAKRRLTLSPQHFGGSSYSGLGVAAHEAGHIIQHVDGHRPLLWRVSAVKATVFLSLPVIAAGIFLIIMPGMKATGLALLALGWPLIAITNLITMPIEMDASERAKKRLGQLKVFKNLDERVGIERVIDAAGANYIDGVFTALSWIRSIVPNLFR